MQHLPVIKIATEHQIIVAVVGSRTDSIAHSRQMDSTSLLATTAAVITSAAVTAGRQQTLGSAIKHNNFCAFFASLFELIGDVFYYK